ncbi:MAG: hypothetical protein K2Z81_07695, partial [Cyanobacteria bacterium]|nr:hypothetical protein [Cyanobacteriota bacterium]
PVDGKALNEQVYTENINSDFTIEHQGAYHFCFMAYPLHSLSWGYYALLHAGQPVPQAQFHHFQDVWKRMKPTFLERRFAYIAGQDWPRYAHGLSFIMPALVVLQQKFGDSDARMIERLRFQTLELEQLDNADGSFFGKRFTHNDMRGHRLEFESDCYADVGLCYLLHKSKASIQPPKEAEFYEHLADRHISEDAGLLFVRTSDLFSSFAWRTLHGPFPMALFVPKGLDDSTEWGSSNLIGRVVIPEIDVNYFELNHKETLVGKGFKTTGEIIYQREDGSPAYRHELSFEVHPEEKKAWIKSRFTADDETTATVVEGLRLHVVNDLFNGGKHHWYWDGGDQEESFGLKSSYPDQETATFLEQNSRWVNLDNKLGIIQLNKSHPFELRRSDIRNGPWKSIHYDILDCPKMTGGDDVHFNKGDVILETRFLLVAGDVQATIVEAKKH